MLKKILLFLCFFQIQLAVSQKSLKEIIKEIPGDYSYDSTEKNKGVLIQNEPQILKNLMLTPLTNSKYYLVNKYTINNLIVLFISKQSAFEDEHFAILLDTSLNIIDTLEQTAYSNDEGFYKVASWVVYNVITKHTNNLYNKPDHYEKYYSITNNGFKLVKDQVIIQTPSGVNIRNKPTTKSEIVGKASNFATYNYVSTDYEIDSTSVFDNGKYVKNYWLAISNQKNTMQLGYVFGAFAKRRLTLNTDNYKIVFNQISKEYFENERKKNKKVSSEDKIEDPKEIKKILQNQFIGSYNEKENYFNIKKVISDNGKVLGDFLEGECAVMAYYPQYHYLLFECGHSSDYLINLKNGEDDIERIGNPDYYFPSPQNTFRINGYYTGHSFKHYLEKNNENSAPTRLFVFSSILPSDLYEKFFWKDDNTIMLKYYGGYFKIEIQKH